MDESTLGVSQLAAYLRRIGQRELAGAAARGDALRPSRELLDGLVYAHQCSVPFETADLHLLGVTPDVSLNALFKKVVEDGHGGYCFELNKLFEALLAACGFDVRPCLCRAVRGREGRMPINHRGVLVRLDADDLFVDVGFGGPLPAGALELADELVQVVRGETFIPRRIDDSWWAIDRISQAQRDLYGDEGPSRRQTELELCTAQVEDIDFDSLNLTFSQPGVLFRDSIMANLRTREGFKSINRGVLSIRQGGASEKRELSSEAEMCAALEEHFGFRPYGL